jgi:peptide/nickel transport system permease protein
LTKWLIQRTALLFLLLIGASLIAFALLREIPGGPLSLFLAAGTWSQEDVHRLTEQMGLRTSLPRQYVYWLGHIIVGDWGRSYRDGSPVFKAVFRSFGATALVMATSGIITLAIRTCTASNSIPSSIDVKRITAAIALFGLVASCAFYAEPSWFPDDGPDGSLFAALAHLFIPATALAATSLVLWGRKWRPLLKSDLPRGVVPSVDNHDPKITGYLTRLILQTHLVRTGSMRHLPFLFGCSLAVEAVFAWPGLGHLFLDSLTYRDYPLLIGVLMLTAFLKLLFDFFSDFGDALSLNPGT